MADARPDSTTPEGEETASSVSDDARRESDSASILSELGADADALPLSFGDGRVDELDVSDTNAASLAPERAPVAIPVVPADPSRMPESRAGGAPSDAGLGIENPLIAGPPEIVEIPVRPRGLFRAVFSYAIFIGFFLFAIIFATRVIGPWGISSQLGSFGITIALVVMVSLVLGVLPWLQRWRARRRATRIVLDDPTASVTEMAGQLMRRRPWLSGAAGVIELSERLAAIGRTNAIFRMAGRRNFWPIRPAGWSFEPRPLDESDPTFLELADAMAAQNAESGFEFTRPDSLPLRRVRRNIRMKGGYFSLGLILFFWGRELYDLYLTRRPDIWLALFTFLLANKLFGSTSGGYGGVGWYLVSRGLLLDLRKAKYGVPCRIYDRLSSNLVVYQSTRQTWSVSVANDEYRFYTVATSREVELLLRTWTSDVAPPSADIVRALLGANDGESESA